MSKLVCRCEPSTPVAGDVMTLRTIEFNTSDTSSGSQSNGGAVARKNRDSAFKFVIGYEKTRDPATPPARTVA
jgi:hypothetical protein